MPDVQSKKRMRHIPPSSWFLRRIDHHLRETIDLLYQSAFGTSHENRDLEHLIEEELRDVIHLIHDFAELAGGPRHSGEANRHLRVELEEAISAAIRSLEAVDAAEFGVRASHDSFEGSPWEALLATWLVIESRLETILEDVEKLDENVRSQLAERLQPPTPSLDPYLLEQWKEA